MTKLIILLGAIFRFILLVYGDWQDRHFEVKYTDIDYSVFGDAARAVFNGGSPYDRPTYRYSPFVAWILIPNEILTPLWGKIVFCFFDLVAATLIWRWDQPGQSKGRIEVAVAMWLFNPFTATISTRGNCDSITVVSILVLIKALQKEKWALAGFLWSLAVHWRVFPVIYAPSILVHLTKSDPLYKNKTWIQRLLSKEVVVFGVTALLTGSFFGLSFYLMYGEEFLENAFLYHAGRLDPRHNFSLHFYPVYLTHWKDSSLELGLLSIIDLGKIGMVIQIGVILAIAIQLGHDLPLAFTLSTIAFVAFNKVSTAQYFTWYFGLIPLLVLRVPLRRLTQMVLPFLTWSGALGHWLFWAYLLEFQGLSVYFWVWVASCIFLVAHVHLLQSIIRVFVRSKEY